MDKYIFTLKVLERLVMFLIDKELLKKIKRERTIFQSISPRTISDSFFGCVVLGFIILFSYSVVIESMESARYLIRTSIVVALIFEFIVIWITIFIEEKQKITAVEFLLKIKEKVLKEDYDRFFDYIQSKNLFDKNINECFQQCERDIQKEKAIKDEEDKKRLEDERNKKIEAEIKKRILLATMIRNNKK